MKKQANKIKKLPLERLQIALCSMDAAGAKGFEGLFRDIFARLLNRTVYLMKSGTQGGGDAYSGAFPNQLSIVWEDKRYKPETDLPVDQLIAKLDQACSKYPEMDIWLLVTTKEISSQHIVEIQNKGNEKGIGTLVIDWSENETRLSKLAALCVQFPDVLKCYKLDINDTDFKGIKKNPQFKTTIDEIKKNLTTPCFSYSYHHDYCKQFLITAFSNKDCAYNHLGCYGDIKGGHYLVKRKKTSEALDLWWKNAEEQFAIVHGSEGNGKSWAVFDWIDSNINSLPITLIIPAQKLESIDVIHEVSTALKRTISNDDRPLTFYQKQISRWKNHTCGEIKMLLVIDGLNQNHHFKFKYEELLLSLVDDSWSSFVKVIVTVRTGFFLEQCHGFGKIIQNSEGKKRAAEIEVTKFDTIERNEFLLKNGIELEDVDQALLNLVSTPRYAVLAIRHSKELKGIQECSVEHLMLLDWKDRLMRQGKSVSSNDFLRIIQSLASKYHETLRTSKPGLSLKDIKDFVRDNTNETDSDLVSFIDELAQDSWLSKNQKCNLFEFKSEWISSALALVLINQLEDNNNYEEEYASYIEPLNNNDYVSKILFSALKLTMIGKEKKQSLASFFCEKFLKLQNQDRDSIEQFYKIVLIEFDFYSSVLEKNIRTHDHQTIDFLKRTLLCACEKDKTKETIGRLRNLLNKWLGVCTLMEGIAIHKLQGMELKKLQKDLDAESLLSHGIELTIKDFYLDPHTFSFFSSIPFEKTSLSGVISRLLFHFSRDTLLAWLLRWNCTEEIKNELIALIEKVGPAISAKRKVMLLERLADYSARPDMFHFVDLNQQENEFTLKEIELGEWSCNPEYQPTENDKKYVDEKINALDIQLFGQTMNQLLEETNFLRLETFLARFNVDRLSDIEKQIFEAKKDEPLSQRVLSSKMLQDAFIILDKSPLAQENLNALLKRPQIIDTSKEYRYVPLLNAHISTLNFKQQLQFIKKLPKGMSVGENIRFVLDYKMFDEAEFEKELLTCEENHQLVKLFFIGLNFSFKSLNKSIAFKDFILQKIKENNPILKPYSLKWIVNSGDRKLWNEAYEIIKPTIYSNKNIDDPDTINLILHATQDNLEEIQKWCHPQFFPVAIKARGYKDADLTWFADLINEHLKAMVMGKCVIPLKGYGWYIPDQFDLITFEKMSEIKPELLDSIENLAASTSDMVTAFNGFPIKQLCLANWKVEPERTEKAWILLFNKMRQSSRISESFKNIPYLAASKCETAIDLIFHTSNTDFELLQLAVEMQEKQKITLLLFIIRKSLVTDLPAVKAKGLVLAGFLCESENSESLWKEIKNLNYSFGWLKAVRQKAYGRYQKGKWAYHWFMEYLRAGTDSDAYGFHILFEANYDMRANIWISKNINDEKFQMSRRKYIFFNLQQNQRIHILDRQKSELSDTLGFERIEREMLPWW